MVLVGEATGFAIVVLLSPVAGLQTKDPVPVALSCTLLLVHSGTSDPASSAGSWNTAIVIVSVAEHWLLSVIRTE